jgi:hypothetical protein
MLCLNRNWKPRRLTFTKATILISQGDDVLDAVPLHEVMRIRDLSTSKKTEYASSEVEDDEDFQEQSEQDLDDSKRRATTLQIETAPEGYNSGRVYQVRAKNSQELRSIVTDLSRLSAIAIETAQAKSRMKKIQDSVARFIDSDWVQRFLACMIFAVPSFVQLLSCSAIFFLLKF